MVYLASVCVTFNWRIVINLDPYTASLLVSTFSTVVCVAMVTEINSEYTQLCLRHTIFLYLKLCDEYDWQARYIAMPTIGLFGRYILLRMDHVLQAKWNHYESLS